ncbi:MAG: hypothetical protein H6700_07130 [Myxococcales bacterium]|nr:hypothetical protein [Myxococcales bacterium]
MSAAGLRAYASSRVAVCTAAFALVSVASAAHPFRGLSLSSLWLLDAVARFDVWRAGGDVAAMRAAFADPEGVLPFVPWVASLLPFPSLLALRVLGVVAAGVTAASVASIGHRFWGAGAGFFAACALLALPRFVAAATTTTPTIFALAAVSSLVAVALASRDDARWLPLLAAVGGAAWSTSLYAWLAAVGVAYLVVVDAGRRPTAGHVRIRAVPLATLLMPALWAGALIAAAPYLHAHTFERLGRLLGVWLERRGEPLLFAGRFYGAARIPALSPPVMWAISAPVAVVIVAVGGAVAAVGGVGSRRPADARQVWGTIVALAWALPVALRSAYHGGVDLWALGALPLALSAGVGLEGARAAICSRLPRGPAVAGVALVALAAVAASEVRPVAGRYEAFFSAAIGGVSGAVDAGYSRSAHAPVPPEIGEALRGEVCDFAVLSGSWELRPVLDRYRQLGLIGADCRLVDPSAARLAVLVYDDTLPEFYTSLADFVAATGPDVWRVTADGVTLIAVGAVP